MQGAATFLLPFSILLFIILPKNASSHVKIGVLMDGKMFDNSYQRGQTLDFAVGVGQMILGFDEGVAKINHGGKAYFFLPYKLGYGEEGTPDGSIPPKADLVFYVELL